MASLGPNIFLVLIEIVKATLSPTRSEVVASKPCRKLGYMLLIVIDPNWTFDEKAFYIEETDIASIGYTLGGEFMFIIVKLVDKLVILIELNKT